MKEIDIFGKDRAERFTKTRVACRGIVVRGGKILASREAVTDTWMIPGGGVEDGETLEACCVREIMEETGYLVQPREEYLVLNEYYDEYRYVSHYFICDLMGMGQRRLTDTEKARGLIHEWIEIQALLAILVKYEAYAGTDEEKYGVYLREYKALNAYLNDQNQ